MRITVPGNLLLLGEYAVTLSGGQGIALAVEPSLILTVKPARACIVTGFFEGKSYVWCPEEENPPPIPLLESVFNHFKERPPLHIHIDTSSFSYDDGTKKGFGSSAAVTVGLTYLLLQHHLERKPDLLGEVFPEALEIHRSFQGGRGSGYDILASLMGGAGIFAGGNKPSWKPFDPEILPKLCLVRGEKSYSTREALERFEQLMKTNPELIDRYKHLSNRLVNRFALKPSQQDFKRAAHLNGWLQKQLGYSISWVDSRIKPEIKPEIKSVIKSLGAGGEMGAYLFENNNLINERFLNGIDTNNLKNWEFDKEAPQNFCLERVTIAERQDTSEDGNFGAKSTLSKTNSPGCLCLKPLRLSLKGVQCSL